MDINHLHNVTIIIRSARERTEGLCKQMIIDQGIPEPNIFIVREVPFSAAMRKSFEIGLSQGKPWTFCVDADVLLRPGSVSKMIEFSKNQNSKVCEVQGFVMDKFFGGPRQAGNHLYRTSLLEKVIECIPEEGTDLRPERYTLGKMQENGYPWIIAPIILGVHDDEQFYFDIYRKAFVYALKHLDRAELLITHWRENSLQDFDYKVALKGFSDSIYNTKEVFINSEQPLYRQKFNEAGFEEKNELAPDTISLHSIEEKIKDWNYIELYHTYFPARDGLDKKSKVILKKFGKNIKQNGFLHTGKLVMKRLLKGF